MNDQAPPSPWLTVREAAEYWKCGARLVYREIRSKRLKAVAIGGRRELRTKREWLDAALEERAS